MRVSLEGIDTLCDIPIEGVVSKIVDILPSLKGIPTVARRERLTHLGGFLLLAALSHHSLHRLIGRVPPLIR